MVLPMMVIRLRIVTTDDIKMMRKRLRFALYALFVEESTHLTQFYVKTDGRR